MRIAFRLLSVAASSLAFAGFMGCGEDNEKSVVDDSMGKTGVDPKAPSNYEHMQPKPIITPAPTGSAPKAAAPSPDGGAAAPK
jgi:hypothetical protein